VAAARTSGRTRAPRDGATRSARPLLLVVWIAIGLVLVAIALVALAVPATFDVRGRLDDGRRAMEQARRAVIDGDARTALGRFRAAKVSFDEAAARSDSGVLSVVHRFPVVGGNVDVVGSLSRAGSSTAEAGVQVARAVRELPGGIDGLAPAGGRIPLERIPPLARAVGRAHDLVDQALREVRTSATRGLLPPIDDAKRTAGSSLSDLDTTLGAAAGLLEGLPAFLGADGTRSYFFGAENPAELRGTGGLIGAYSILRVSDGRMSFSSFRPIQSLPLLNPNDVTPPNPDYHRLYDPQRGGDGFWLNVNMTPDFPSAAEAILTGYQAATGRRLDGVVTADPFALRALLEATGPTRVPRIGATVNARNVVPFLANEAYARLQNPDQRKSVLGDVAESVVQRFLHAGAAIRAVRAVGEAAGEGHIQLFSDDANLQSALSDLAAGGAFRAPASEGSDLLSVIANNGAANKVDYYVDRDVRYDVRLARDGSASAAAEVRFQSHAPTGGLPAYVLGPNAGATRRAGQDVSIVNVYCGLCTLTGASRDGRSIDAGRDHELGSNFWQDYLTIDPGATVTTQFAYDLPKVWSGGSAGGTYTLRFLNQPTIRPTAVSISVRIPGGMHVIDSSAGVVVDGAVARWTGTPGRTLDLQVSFAPSLPSRLWHSLVG
jgi:hypothetical protein